MIRCRFDATWTPPAPIVRAIVVRPGIAIATGEYPALIDTGAASTVIPAEVVDELHLVELDQITIESFGGYETDCPAYDVHLQFVGDSRMIDVLALATESIDYILVGRDVLKHFLLTFDGPGNALMII
jgi:predicted aspartyl protease